LHACAFRCVNSEFGAARDDQQSIALTVYKSTAADPYFTTEPGTSSAGSLSVDSCRDKVANLADRKVWCSFNFGLTEIKVTVTNAMKEKTTHKLSFNI
jgi:hypothetical protein